MIILLKIMIVMLSHSKYVPLYYLDEPNVTLPDANEDRSKWLLETCHTFVTEYVFQSGISGIVSKTSELQQKTKPPFKCRANFCEKTYVFHSARVRFVLTECMLPILLMYITPKCYDISMKIKQLV